jgi:hypothetical protein
MGEVVQNIFRYEEKHLARIEESVFSAAHDLARSSSIENVEIEHVLNRAQISRNTFHKLFHSVDGLFRKLGQRLTNEAFAHYEPYLTATPDVARRVANKTRLGLRIIANAPFFGQLALRAEWPSCDPRHMMYQDIEKDIREGIEQGCFSDMPPSVGVSIILGCLRGAVRDHCAEKQSEAYINQTVLQVLISLGLDHEAALSISKVPAPELPTLPSKGLASKVFAVEGYDKN